MSEREHPSFTCMNCGAQYKIVRVEGMPATTGDRELTCINCDAVLPAREDRLVLKYFLVSPRTRRNRPRVWVKPTTS